LGESAEVDKKKERTELAKKFPQPQLLGCAGRMVELVGRQPVLKAVNWWAGNAARCARGLEKRECNSVSGGLVSNEQAPHSVIGRGE
jgi:hypothetical protein